MKQPEHPRSSPKATGRRSCPVVRPPYFLFRGDGCAFLQAPRIRAVFFCFRTHDTGLTAIN
jgi:hypothetical protein